MKVHDGLLALAMLVLAVAVVATAQRFPPAPGQPVGPGLFPTVIGSALGLAALVLLVRSLREPGPRKWLTIAPVLRRARGMVGFLLAPVSVVFYLSFSERLGFLPCSILILIVLLTAYGVRLRAGVPFAFAASAVVYAVFARVLSVPLPRGLLEPYL
jgi:putative tricarboxylic transport membrane protein